MIDNPEYKVSSTVLCAVKIDFVFYSFSDQMLNMSPESIRE